MKVRFLDRIKEIWSLPQKYFEILDRLNKLTKIVNELTTVHADVYTKIDDTQIIVIGRFKNNDYIHAFTVRHESLEALIEILKREEKYAKVGRFDMPTRGLNFSTLYPRERF